MECPLGEILHVVPDIVHDAVFVVLLTAAFDVVVLLAFLLDLAVIDSELRECIARLSIENGGGDIAFVDVDGDDRLCIICGILV